jgi:hypothetical protein
MDEVQVRQNEFLLQLQGIYALHYSFAILFFYHFSANLSPLSLLFPSRFSAKTERATPRTAGDLPWVVVLCLGLLSPRTAGDLPWVVVLCRHGFTAVATSHTAAAISVGWL